MGYNIRKIDPLDLQPRKAVGINIPFSGEAVFNSTYQSADAMKSNLINYFLTGKGERLMNPGFGAGLRNVLFENITQDRLVTLKESIIEELRAYFPRVVVNDLRLDSIPDQHLINFSLKYAISETNIVDEVVINFEQ